MTDKGEDATPGDRSQYAQAAEKIRETSKWLITTFGALGAALVTSLSLSNLADVEGADLTSSLVGFGLGLLGTSAAIGACASVLLTSTASLADLAEETADADATRLVSKHPHVLAGFSSPDELVRAHTRAQRDRISTFQAAAAHLEAGKEQEATKTIAEFKRAERRVELTSPIVEGVLGFVALDRLQRRLLKALVVMLVGLATAGVGIGLFARFGTVADKDPASTPAAAARPVQAVVDLNRMGTQTFKGALGDGCNFDAVPALVVASTPESAEVVVVPGSGCDLHRFSVSSETASVCPVESAVQLELPEPGGPGDDGVFAC